MKSLDTRNKVEIIGLITVVLSLLLVTYEIRQSNSIASATTTYELVRDINQFNYMGIADPVFAEFLSNLSSSDFSPNEAQSMQAQLLAWRFLNIWIIQETAHENGLFSEEQLEITRQDVKNVMLDYPALVPYLRSGMESQPSFANYSVLDPLML